MDKILNICRCKDKHRSCNVCGARTHQGQSIIESTVVHEMSFGKNNQSITIAICNVCLSEFADKLWEYLEKGE